MRILFVTPFLPSPARFGGQRRLEGLMRELAKRHEVSVASFNRPDPWTQVSLDETQRYCKRVLTLPERDFEERDKRSLQLRSLFSPNSFEHVVKVRRRDFQALLDDALAAEHYDVVQVEFVQMATFAVRQPQGRRSVVVLDEHNIEFDVLRRTADASNNVPRRVYNALNWRKLAREERRAWRRFHGLTFTSARDEAFVHDELPVARTAVIPNGVDVDGFQPAPGHEEPDTLLFFGAINYFPNHDGVVFFIDEVLPLIRRVRPNVRLRIVGPGAAETVLARQGSSVEVVGMVDDVGPHIERAGVVVVPLRIGGGTRLKIVEAMSKGKAIVSTRLGAEGIDVVDEQHALLADEPQAFADAVCRVLADASLARRLGSEARRLAEQKYSWRKLTEDLETFYRTLGASSPA